MSITRATKRRAAIRRAHAQRFAQACAAINRAAIKRHQQRSAA